MKNPFGNNKVEKMILEQKAKAYDEALERARRIKSGVATDIPDGTPVYEPLDSFIRAFKNYMEGE